MDPLINFIAGQLAQYEEGFWKASKDFIAAITGPGAILGVLRRFCGSATMSTRARPS